MLIRCHLLARGTTEVPHAESEVKTPFRLSLGVAAGDLGAAGPGQREPAR